MCDICVTSVVEVSRHFEQYILLFVRDGGEMYDKHPPFECAWQNMDTVPKMSANPKMIYYDKVEFNLILQYK